MPRAHRNGDSRYCGATTDVVGQSTVFVNNRLWSVDGDPNSHGGGPNKPIFPPKNVYVENKNIICSPSGDTTYSQDALLHPPGGGGGGDDPAIASPDVWVYEAGAGGGGSG